MITYFAQFTLYNVLGVEVQLNYNYPMTMKEIEDKKQYVRELGGRIGVVILKKTGEKSNG